MNDREVFVTAPEILDAQTSYVPAATHEPWAFAANPVGRPVAWDQRMTRSSMTILLVEDNPGDVRLLREMFNENVINPTKMTHVTSMIDAEKHVAEHPVDVILLDLGLPDTHGLAAVRRAHAAAAHIALVVLTGMDDESLAVQALQEGAQDYLVKGQIETRGLLRSLRHAIERKFMEEEVRVAKERAEQVEILLHDAVESMSEGFVIFDHEDRFVLCNETYRQTFRQIHARAADRLRPGVHLEDIMRHVLAIGGGGAGAREREPDWLAEHLRYHRQTEGAFEQGHEDGSWFLVTNRRMKNGGTAGLRVDITALKQAQVAQKESEARLDRAQEIARIGSWELDIMTGRYVWSREMYRIRGIAAEDFSPDIDNVSAFVHPDDYPSIRAWIVDLIAGAELDAREVRIVRPDGEGRMLRVEGRAVTDTDGVVRHLAGTMQDITERRLIEQQLAQAQKMEAIGNLTGGMAHDFNNGLGVIIGNLDLLRRLVKADPAAAELCDDARDGALRCADLIRLLLAFARRQPLHPLQIDVNALVERTASLLTRTIGEDITLTLYPGADLSSVVADPAQLEAALTNLANNARDAMPRGGRLDITTTMAELDARYATHHPEANPGEYVLIEVTDTGTGIAPEIISSIFEPFFTTKEPGRGTGLGLSMVFGFVTQSGGHLTVNSEPNLGTTFRIYLPPAEIGVRLPAPDDPHPSAGGDETLLVVEDNAPLRQAAARQLLELGYRVLEAEHSAAALAILASGEHVDLLFTDVVMPGKMDGLDLAGQATRLQPGLKVILTSGFTGARGGDDRMARCPFHLLNKPYGYDELARLVRETLDRGDCETTPHGEAGLPIS
jgi:PAS domain S-box-containing protein